MYYAAAAEEAFAAAGDARALRYLKTARAAARRDEAVAWWLAGIYSENDYPGDALSLYAAVLPRSRRLAVDALMFRRQYADLLASIGSCYVRLGDAGRAEYYFRASLAVNPDQPMLAGRLSREALEKAAADYRARPRVVTRPAAPSR
jgi:hypothetical protein